MYQLTSVNSKSLLNANVLELHYWLVDSSHVMDAFIHNDCETEFLGFLREVAAVFELQITVETEPLADGGIRRWFRIISKNENKKAIIATALVTSLISAIFITPLSTSIAEVTKHVVAKFYEDTEFKTLEKDKLKLEIENLKVELEYKKQKLDKNTKIVKRRSNFYERLDKYPKISKVSIVLENNNKELIRKESIIARTNFLQFILASDNLDVEPIENAIIEIISPVLKKGEYKWRGIYNGEIIAFSMKSNEFKTLVQTGKIEFKNGSSIKCLLHISRKLDVNGNVQVTGYDIVRVNEYFENDKPIETPEFKKHKQRLMANHMQTSLADMDNF